MRWTLNEPRLTFLPNPSEHRALIFALYRAAFRDTPLFFETMRAHPGVFRNRFTVQHDNFTGKIRLLDRKGTR